MLAVVLAAWLGTEIGGKGTGVVQWLTAPPATKDRGFHPVDLVSPRPKGPMRLSAEEADAVEARIVEECERQLLPHAVAVLRFALETGPHAFATAALLDRMGQFSQWRRRYADAVTYLTRALAIKAAVLKPADPRMSVPLRSLADLYRSKGVWPKRNLFMSEPRRFWRHMSRRKRFEKQTRCHRFSGGSAKAELRGAVVFATANV